ncbi:MAG: hypothetical protein ABI760_16290 [Ferruginibacter sp.]
MRRIRTLSLFTFMFAISFFMITCKHEIPGYIDGGIPSQTSNCSPDSVYFANEIQPLIISNCATTGCHDANSHKEGVELTSYSKIRGHVNAFNGSNSKLYTVCIKTNKDRMPPAPMTPLAPAQLAKILKWINQGALNNQCTGGCDTTLFTYSGAVAPMMNTFCKGCHNPGSPGGGIDLSTYATIKAQAINGKLVGSIAHSTGFAAMPKGGNKLLDCQITQLKKWIQAGTQND